MKTSSHILAALTVIASSSLAMNAIAQDKAVAAAAPALVKAPAPAPATKKKCYNETANLSITFKAQETTAAAAIAYPDAKIKEVEGLLAQTSSDYTLQSMNYNINKNQPSRYGASNSSNDEWNIRGSFNVQFSAVDSAQNALVTLDKAEFFPRLNVNKNKTRNCK